MRILIMEDEALIALGLSMAAEEIGASVIGPVATVAEALVLLDEVDVSAAILDANLKDRDATPVALCLIDRAVPFVIHTGTGLPAGLAAIHPTLPVIMKPAAASEVVANLLSAIETGSARPK